MAKTVLVAAAAVAAATALFFSTTLAHEICVKFASSWYNINSHFTKKFPPPLPLLAKLVAV